MTIVDSLLSVGKLSRTKFQIILWWELRRILYNFIVLIVGLVSIGIISLFVNHEPGADIIDPLLILFFAFLCNIAYTFGWIIELFLPNSQSYGPKIFKSGLYFTFIIILVFALCGIFGWIGTGK